MTRTTRWRCWKKPPDARAWSVLKRRSGRFSPCSRPARTSLIEAARGYAAASKILALGSFDRLVRRHELDAGRDDRTDSRGPSVATELAEIAQELYDFGVSDLGEPFAIPREGPRVVAMLRGSKTSLRALWSREYFTRNGKVATQQALADALLVVEGFAQDQDQSRLYMRCAEQDSELWLDLGDHTGRAVRITARGWSVEEHVPVLFKRTTLTAPLPEPRAAASSATCGSGSTSAQTTGR